MNEINERMKKMNSKKTTHRKFFVGFLASILMLQNVFTSPVLADYYATVNELFPKIEKYISSQINSDKKSNILLITVRKVKLSSNEEYQTLHNLLQNKFPNKCIVDVYVDQFENIIIPQPTYSNFPKDDENNYNQNDFAFKSMLNAVNVNHISLIDEEKKHKIPENYYYLIASCIYNVYTKVMDLTNKYINHVNNPLINSIEIERVTDGVGEFLALGDFTKMVLSPDLFNESNSMYSDSQQRTLDNIEHTVNHELSHAIEYSLVKKIFQDVVKDQNIKIAPNSINTLTEVYFSGGNSTIGECMRNMVLSDMNVPNHETAQKEFIKQNLSGYANTNSSEFFAEILAYGFFMNESNNKYISKLAQQELINIINGQGDIYNYTKNSILKFLKENNIIP